MRYRQKAHLHSEQWDDTLHAECGAGDGNEARILNEDSFGELPRSERCPACTEYYWPLGGDPE